MIEVLHEEEDGDELVSRGWALSKPTVLRVERADRDVGTSSRDVRARNWDINCVENRDHYQLGRRTDDSRQNKFELGRRCKSKLSGVHRYRGRWIRCLAARKVFRRHRQFKGSSRSGV
jgi:hypothetical protein